MTPLNEVQFVGNVKSWIDQICRTEGPDFPFEKAEMEDYPSGKRTRKDLVLFNREGKKVLSGEVKLPDRMDGRTPYDSDLIEDAHIKASTDGIDYFFTWNVNSFVLWQTYKAGTPLADRRVFGQDWFEYRDSEHLRRPEAEEGIKARLREFLRFFAEILSDKRPFPLLALDKRFIHVLKRALDGPQNHSRTAIARRAEEDKRFLRQVERWVRDNLGTEFRREDQDLLVETAARFSCYVLTIKILFYDALCRQYEELPKLAVSSSTKAEQLERKFEKAFRHAEEVSGDYETVFHGDEFGNCLPLLNDVVVDDWRRLIKQVDDYDFTSIPYDIIGSIFEGLISPVERHRNGQHYTKSEIVDLINAFCIRNAADVVIDPACGGGTFLVRAYARKQWLEKKEKKNRTHENRLCEIYGTDVSIYPAHLTVVSLATRDLGSEANYPRIANDDFFHIRRGVKAFPAGVERKGKLAKVIPAALNQVDAIVGNPPYVRQEFIDARHKRTYAATVLQEWPDFKPSGRSDLHVYFWPHASSFLPDDKGYFGFLTSSSWLDVEYGFALQRWILENFCIEAILESSVEPWFSDARVATAVTVLRREPALKKRMDNLVRFVQVRRPLEEIYTNIEVGDDRLDAAEKLRVRILETKRNSETADWRIRVVRQRDLIEGPDKENPSHHRGGKWGIPLRAPDIYFELMDRFGDKFIPLKEQAEVRFGVKTGCDAFFFPRDITDEVVGKLDDAELKKRYGISKKDTKKIRICKAGDGSVHTIEAEFLEPVIATVMELDSPVVNDSLLEHHVLLVSKPKSQLRGTQVLKYLRYGETHPMGSREKSPVHEKETVAARTSEQRFWYDITDGPRPRLCWPKAHQYKHTVSRNPKRWILNCRLYAVDPKEGIDDVLLQGALLSTITILMKFLYGRSTGREGNLDTMVSDVQAMPVLDLRGLDQPSMRRISDALKVLVTQKTENIASEAASGVRRKLDDAVLMALGATVESDRNRLIDTLYSSLTEQVAETRRLELIAQKNRLKAARGGESTPDTTVNSVWKIPDETDEAEA